METQANRDRVQGTAHPPTGRTKALAVSELGLVEMTRQGCARRSGTR
jgi:hypothetical protein